MTRAINGENLTPRLQTFDQAFQGKPAVRLGVFLYGIEFGGGDAEFG
jgi:hypothetical protein